MRRSPLFRLVAGLFALTAVHPASAASPRDRRFFSVHYGVGVEAPAGWTLSQHTGYSTILVVLIHPDGSRISLSAAPTPAKDARALAAQNRPGLEAQKMVITGQSSGARGGVLVDARRTDRDELVRQLYLVRPTPEGGRQAVVLTLVTRSDHLASAGPGFDWAVVHLLFEAPSAREESPADASHHDEPSAGEHAADKDSR
jgi:hypothetical protein